MNNQAFLNDEDPSLSEPDYSAEELRIAESIILTIKCTEIEAKAMFPEPAFTVDYYTHIINKILRDEDWEPSGEPEKLLDYRIVPIGKDGELWTNYVINVGNIEKKPQSHCPHCKVKIFDSDIICDKCLELAEEIRYKKRVLLGFLHSGDWQREVLDWYRTFSHGGICESLDGQFNYDLQPRSFSGNVQEMAMLIIKDNSERDEE